MSETPETEPSGPGRPEPCDVYEPPMLAEVGDFADLTRGSRGDVSEGILSFTLG
ncbi:lasso RiPP family leader peptide-containing protein [Streptomyces gamaensis]|uniref:Lasso RiPP family leader peptide-containing protein n=1 Tax=Streptomyces gamaensis TaxID=1763542 RepID=A0ABW0YW76_9ACTN